MSLILKSVRGAIPWWAKIVIKLAFQGLPIGYSFWKKIGLFEHGAMNDPEYAYGSLIELSAIANVIEYREKIPFFKKPEDADFVVLEIGCGDSLFSGVISHLMGASRTYLIDAGSYASYDIGTYENLCLYLTRRGYIHTLSAGAGVDALLHNVNATYYTDGANSLRAIPDASVNFSFSNAVIEHIKRDEVAAFASELFRVTSPNCVSVHRVDLRDHLGGALNNLMVSHKIWESSLFRGSSFYTNRLRINDIVEAFASAGFVVDVTRKLLWPNLPTPRSKLASPYNEYVNEDLLVMEFDLLLRR